MFHIAGVRGLHRVGGERGVEECGTSESRRCDASDAICERVNSQRQSSAAGGGTNHRAEAAQGTAQNPLECRTIAQCVGAPNRHGLVEKDKPLAPVVDIQRVADKSPLDVQHERATSTPHRGCSSLDRPCFGLMVIAQRDPGHWHDASTPPLRPVANPAVAMTSHGESSALSHWILQKRIRIASLRGNSPTLFGLHVGSPVAITTKVQSYTR